MKTYVIIPVKRLEKAKLRLSNFLSKDERRNLSIKMLKDILAAVFKSKGVDGVIVVSGDDEVLELAKCFGAYPLKERGEGLNTAVSQATSHCVDKCVEAAIIILADAPLIEAEDIEVAERLLSMYDVVISPSHDGRGTNLLGMRPPNAIDTRYGRNSFIKHVGEAIRRGKTYRIYKSPRIELDIDTPLDLERIARVGGFKKESIEFIKEILSKKSRLQLS